MGSKHAVLPLNIGTPDILLTRSFVTVVDEIAKMYRVKLAQKNEFVLEIAFSN